MSFNKTINAMGDPVASALQPGKRALPKAHAKKITCKDESRLKGSIFLDEALKAVKRHSQASRWDYGLGYLPVKGPEIAIWIEVHSASTDEVRTVLNKLKWLKDYLDAEAPELKKLTPSAKSSQEGFVWIASNGVHILRNSPQARLLAMSGLKWPQSALHLA